ncbi:MAG: sigma-70 family RNA polymerase sigma factor [Planctomycetes bacterium]|nr:sigma-70 family RNA polymerase sigma factor [Planctomycetota bacterium]
MWPNSTDTQELIVSAKAGDASAAGALLEKHRDALRKLVALRTDRAIQGRVDASDIVQDALVEANRRLGDYLRDPRMPFHLWLRQIAKDRMIDAHRRHRLAGQRSVDREQAVTAWQDQSALDLAAQLRDGRELTPATALLRQELQERFRAALAQLDDIDREIIEMRHFEQLANQEVAVALGLTEPAAGMRYLRAMRRLRALLDDTPAAEG